MSVWAPEIKCACVSPHSMECGQHSAERQAVIAGHELDTYFDPEDACECCCHDWENESEESEET